MGCDKPLSENDQIATHEQDVFDQLGEIREELRLPAASENPDIVVAATYVDGQVASTGVSGQHGWPLDPKELGVPMNAAMPLHAEGRALLELAGSEGKEGLEGKYVRLVVDKYPCQPYCQSSFPRLARDHLKLSVLEVEGPGFHAIYGCDVLDGRIIIKNEPPSE